MIKPIIAALAIAAIFCFTVRIYSDGFIKGKQKGLMIMSDCLDVHVTDYKDLCNESSTGFEEMNAIDAHLEGVKCAVESIKMCLGSQGWVLK